MNEIRYVKEPGVFLTRKRGGRAKASGSTQLLLGQRLHVDMSENVDGSVPARTMPSEKNPDKKHKKKKESVERKGFVPVSVLSIKQLLKVFYVDVGQGDGTYIEAEGVIVLIDGGPSRGFHDQLVKRFENLNRARAAAGQPKLKHLTIDAIVVTHFDLDHYFGLVKVIADKRFKISTIYHNGLPRYGDKAGKDLNLGTVVEHADGSKSISTDLRGIASAKKLLANGTLKTKKGNDNRFATFLRAAVKANAAGRLGSLKPLSRRKTTGKPDLLPNTGPELKFEVLGPVTTAKTGPVRLPAFPDPHNVTKKTPQPAPSESHTVNGNSIVLRLVYGKTTFLFGGDLNQPAQKFLREKYSNLKPFAADVNKTCHHGSSDFDLKYLQAVAPNATVFSSGDNGSHDHPLPDAMGAAAKHSRGRFPLVFSTELARETSKSSIKLGHINARSNGETIVMAQKKEKPSLRKIWHSFQLPFAGPFDSH